MSFIIRKIIEAAIFEREIGDEDFNVSAKLDIDVMIVKPEQHNQLEQMCEGREIIGMINKNVTSFVAIYKNKIIHHTGISSSSFFHTRIKEMIRINPKEAYVHDVYTIPEYAGQSVAPFVFQYIHRYLKKRGIEKCITHVWTENQSSKELFLKAGYLQVGKLNLLKVGNSYFWLVTGRRNFFQNKALLKYGRSQIYRAENELPRIRRELIPFLARWKDNQSNVVLFGAGGYARLLFVTKILPYKIISFIVDNNIKKQGQNMMGTNLVIKHPDSLLNTEIDVVIISTGAYQEDIIHDLKSKYKLKIPILKLYPHVEYV